MDTHTYNNLINKYFTFFSIKYFYQNNFLMIIQYMKVSIKFFRCGNKQCINKLDFRLIFIKIYL